MKFKIINYETSLQFARIRMIKGNKQHTTMQNNFLYTRTQKGKGRKKMTKIGDKFLTDIS